jgi:hypothetical protein
MGELTAGSVVIDDEGYRYLITQKLGLFVQAIAIADMDVRYEAGSYDELLERMQNLVGVRQICEPRRVHIEIDNHKVIGD